MSDDCVENELPAKPMTTEQQYRQNILMYVRDKIIDPIMPPVKRYDPGLKLWLEGRDHSLIDKLASTHTDELIKLAQSQADKDKNE